MKKEAIRQFLIPNWKKILIFLIFLLIAISGHILSFAFSDRESLSKPPFYDLLSHFPFFWVIWVLLLAPLILLSNLIVKIGGYEVDFIMRGSFWSFWIIQVIYFYILTCLVIFVWNKLIKRR